MSEQLSFNNASPIVRKMKQWMDNNWNVMLVGRHGVGKTSMIMDAVKLYGLEDDEWLYFSGSTLDPWVDFVGVPKEKQTEDGQSYLELIRPKAFLNDKIKFIFIDEYNRTHKKVRNAAMELIQFKAINGNPFPSLKMVWTAINPHEDEEMENEYDVEQLDPAQEDRFHIQYEIPYRPDKAYFTKKFGSEAADVAIEWWESLKRGKHNHHLLVSPRRLDYALEVHRANGDITDVLPKSVSSEMLRKKLHTVPALSELQELVAAGDKEKARELLADPNNYDLVVKNIVKDTALLEFCTPLLREEKLSDLIAMNQSVRQYALANIEDDTMPFGTVLNEIASANQNDQLVREINRTYQRIEHNKKVAARKAAKASK